MLKTLFAHQHPIKKLLVLVCISAIISLLVGRHYLTDGFPVTHDGENHLMRFANYKQALKEGQFPPRIAPTSYYSTGYPVFNFNYPLANIASTPFSLLKISYQTAFKVISLVNLGLGVLGCMTVIKLHKPGSSYFDLILVAALFVGNSWVLNLLYVRGTIGELMAYSALPWLLVTILWAKNSSSSVWQLPVSALIWALFFLSHNISVLLYTPLIGLTALLYARAQITQTTSWLWAKWIPSIFTGLALSLWFWLPALAEKQFTALEGVGLSREYLAHFPTLTQLLWHPLHFGYSMPGDTDTLSFTLGLPLVFALFVSGAVQLFKLRAQGSFKDTQNFQPLATASLVSAGVLLILLSPYSGLLWEAPFMNLVQFPWRLIGGIIFFLSIYAVIRFHTWPQWCKKAWFALVVLHLMSMWQFRPVDTFIKDPQAYEISVESSSVSNENKSAEFTFGNVFELTQSPEIISGSGEIAVQSWTTTTHSYILTAKTPVLIAEPLMVFPGWVTTSDTGMLWDFDKYARSKEIAGRIAYEVPTGTHTITTTFTQRTWSRLLGNFVSLSAAATLTAHTLYSLKRERGKQ